MELVGPEFRTFAGNGISMFFGLSLALLAGLAYFLRHWFHLALATSVPFLPLFGYTFSHLAVEIETNWQENCCYQ